jgi:DNA-binding CsgD family transcriptional regulator
MPDRSDLVRGRESATPASGRVAVLTGREAAVVRQVAEGLSNDEIAEILRISPRTIQAHVANARRKTGARNRAHLAVIAIREGLVPLDPPPADRDKRWS